MNIILISEFQLDKILDTAFNPPLISMDFSESDFYKEWKDVQVKIKSVLAKLGYFSWNDDGEDYTVADDWGLSRNHDVEINRETMWLDLRVLFTIQRMLIHLRKDYQIIMHHDLFLRSEIPICYFIIKKNEILSQTNDPHIMNLTRQPIATKMPSKSTRKGVAP